MSGSLDDFRIYDGPLSPDEIALLHRHNPEPLSTPMNLSATASDRQVELAWEPSTGNTGVAGYEIYRNGVLIGSSTAARYTDTCLSPETQYFYTVKAYDALGRKSAFSNEAHVDTVPETTSSALLYMCFDEKYHLQKTCYFLLQNPYSLAFQSKKQFSISIILVSFCERLRS